MKRRNWIALTLALVLGMLALTACGEDAPFPNAVKKEPYMETVEALCDAVNKHNPELVADYLYTCSEGTFQEKTIHRAISDYTFVEKEHLPLSEVLDAQEMPHMVEDARRALYRFCQKDVTVESVVLVTLKSSAPVTPKVYLMQIGEKWYVYGLE